MKQDAVVYVCGNYSVAKHYDRAYRMMMFIAYYKDRIVLSERRKADAISKLKTWIEINGKW